LTQDNFRLLDVATGAGTWFDYPECVGFSREPFASVAVGPWACVAGPAGVAAGCFGWLDADTGQVSNTASSGAVLGFVLPHANPYNLWERVYFQRPVNGAPPFTLQIIRPGVRCTLAVSGVFSPKFADGGEFGTRVYTDPATGLAYSGNVTGSLTATPYTLLQSGGPNRRLRMSSFVQPFQN
jgi:hypothetical protein